MKESIGLIMANDNSLKSMSTSRVCSEWIGGNQRILRCTLLILGIKRGSIIIRYYWKTLLYLSYKKLRMFNGFV